MINDKIKNKLDYNKNFNNALGKVQNNNEDNNARINRKKYKTSMEKGPLTKNKSSSTNKK